MLLLSIDFGVMHIILVLSKKNIVFDWRCMCVCVYHVGEKLLVEVQC